MKERHGRIVNLTSIVGVTGNPGQGQLCSRPKAGVLGFTKSRLRKVCLAGHHCQRGVAPGFIDNRHDTRAQWMRQRTALLARIPMGRLGSARRYRCNGFCFCAQIRRDTSTGETMHVNGGMYMA